MTYECGICMNEVSKKKCVPCTRCVNFVCLQCFRTIATTDKSEVVCPYCKMTFTTCRVESLLTCAQIATRRLHIRIELECEYIQVTHDHIASMKSLCDLMGTLNNLHVQTANVRMKLFPLSFLRPIDTMPSLADVGMATRLRSDLSQLQVRTTCISDHIAHILNTSHLPASLVGDCVSNAFDTCHEYTNLGAYTNTPDLRELLEIGLLLFNPHVVRPNAFQYGTIRIVNIRAMQPMETWKRMVTSKCRQSLMILEWFNEMIGAAHTDTRAAYVGPTGVMQNHITTVLDKLERKPKAPKTFRTWFLLYRRWRSTLSTQRTSMPIHLV